MSVIDILTMRLPDALTLPLAMAGLSAVHMLALDDVVMRLAAACTGFALLFAVAEVFRYVRGRDALGLGDAKLFAAAGAWLGFYGLPSVLLGASVAGLIAAGAGVLVGSKIDAETRIPFGPFIAVATWMTWLYGPVV